jgi:hypothetical protein
MEEHCTRERIHTSDNCSSANKGSRPSLEPVAMVALEAGRMLMEAGANAKSVQGIVEMVACGLGAERADLRIINARPDKKVVFFRKAPHSSSRGVPLVAGRSRFADWASSISARAQQLFGRTPIQARSARHLAMRRPLHCDPDPQCTGGCGF